jgi:hypothetical protein
MKTIKHSYGADLNWVKPFARQLGGKIDGNFIVVPDNSIFTGTRYVLSCDEGIVVYYVDVTGKVVRFAGVSPFTKPV